VTAVGLNSAVPLEGGAAEGPVMKEGDPPPDENTRPTMTMFQTSGGDYFRAMGIPVLRGRAFDARDRAASTPVVIVDASLVAALFGRENPIGRRIAFEADGRPGTDDFRPFWREIVGVVGTVKHYGLLATTPYVQLYVPHTQLPSYHRDRRPAMAIVARAERGADPGAIVDTVRRTVAAIDPTIPLYGVQPMQRYLDAATEQPRIASGLVAAFATLAVVLAIVGVYGTLACFVAQRQREIGVRVALGARRSDILRSVIGQGALLTAIGLVIGLLLAVAASRQLAAQLYQVSPNDGMVYIGTALLLAAVAVAASAIPARRASSVDPLITLRN
jgi:putative ABC transport system permease protein